LRKKRRTVVRWRREIKRPRREKQEKMNKEISL
jgi:hypothetical protein